MSTVTETQQPPIEKDETPSGSSTEATNVSPPRQQTPEEIEEQKIKALEFANKLYDILKGISETPEGQKLSGEVRHETAMKNYPHFSSAYPIILRLMARDLRYKPMAFRRFLDKLYKDPGKGMDGFIEHQANYMRLLYEEEQKSQRKHIDKRIANKIYRTELDGMRKYYKKIMEEEKKARNEYSEEARENLAKRKKELLDFTNLAVDVSENEPTDKPMSSLEAAAIKISFGLPVKFSDISIEGLGSIELASLCNSMRIYLAKLQKTITTMHEGIETNVIAPDETKKENPYVDLTLEELVTMHEKLLAEVNRLQTGQ